MFLHGAMFNQDPNWWEFGPYEASLCGPRIVGLRYHPFSMKNTEVNDFNNLTKVFGILRQYFVDDFSNK